MYMVPVLANNTLTITSPRACESSKTGCIFVIHPVFLCQKIERINVSHKIWRILSLCIWYRLLSVGALVR